MLGTHCIKTWSTNQQVVATSSGEAEYYGLGVQGMLRDSGITLGIALCIDSSAAKGIASRRGLGKVRHIELAELWLQDQVARGKIKIEKIRGDDNFSDSLTKHSNPERISQTLRGVYQRLVRGRHAIMPTVAK